MALGGLTAAVVGFGVVLAVGLGWRLLEPADDAPAERLADAVGVLGRMTIFGGLGCALAGVWLISTAHPKDAGAPGGVVTLTRWSGVAGLAGLGLAFAPSTPTWVGVIALALAASCFAAQIAGLSAAARRDGSARALVRIGGLAVGAGVLVGVVSAFGRAGPSAGFGAMMLLGIVWAVAVARTARAAAAASDPADGVRAVPPAAS